MVEHKVQKSILNELLFVPNASFSDLNRYHLDNDHFNFHIQRLLDLGLIEKKDKEYTLTNKGLEVAGMIDTETIEFVKQPKLGVALYIFNEDKSEILLGKRLKEPSLGSVGHFTEKVKFGETSIETAKRCLLNETGLEGDLNWIGTTRAILKRDNEIIQDTVFAVYMVTNIKGELMKESSHTINDWYKVNELKKVDNLFSNLDEYVNIILNKDFILAENTSNY